MEPLSRDTLRGLYAARLAQQRLSDIQRCIQNIYSAVRMKATASEEQFHCYELRGRDMELAPDIIKELQSLFPDCTIDYRDDANFNTRTQKVEVTSGVIVVSWR